MLKTKMPKRKEEFSCNSFPTEGNMVALCTTMQPKIHSAFPCSLVNELHSIQPQLKRGARSADVGGNGIWGYTKQKTGDKGQRSPEPMQRKSTKPAKHRENGTELVNHLYFPSSNKQL